MRPAHGFRQGSPAGTTVGRRPARTLAAIALTGLLAAGFVCDDEESGFARRLADARELWKEAAPPDYEMVLFRGCFCGPEGRGPVLVTVVGGEVESRVYVEARGEVPTAMADLFPDVESLFGIAAEAARRAHRVEAEFDPELGFPTRLAIDWRENVADEEVDYRVERLTPLSNVSPGD